MLKTMGREDFKLDKTCKIFSNRLSSNQNYVNIKT